ncbi:MAG: hypothetical protein JNM25_06950 [Planctomycetes bacterium]|nr:hypothetical protein [Planctomycetota bacterium]
MGLITKLNERFRARRQDAQRIYWTALAKVARSGGDRAPGALVAEVETAATELGKSPEVIEADLELLEQSIALGNAPQELERAKQLLTAAKKESAAARERAAELEKQMHAARNEAEAVFNAAVGAHQLATQRFQDLTETQHRLADAGHPDHKHQNKQARDLHVSVESLQNDLRLVDAELARFTQQMLAEHQSASRDHTRLQFRRASLVEQLNRLGTKTPPEPALAAGETDDDDDDMVAPVPEQIEEPLDGLALLGHEGKGTRTTIHQDDGQ